MRKEKLEEQIKKSIDAYVPDILDNIIEDCEKIERFDTMKKDINVKEENKVIDIRRRRMPKVVGVVAAALIIVIGGASYNKIAETKAVDSVIELDINPSVEMSINKNERVLDVKALNTDGKKVIEDMDFKNVDMDVAINALIGALLKKGYISEDSNSILVSVKNADNKKGNKLEEEITKEIEDLLKSSKVSAAILSQMYGDDKEVKKIASQNKVSEGKAQLIKKLEKIGVVDANGKKLTAKQLSEMSINELKLLMDSKKLNLKDVKNNGKASEKSYIGKDKAKKIAFVEAGVVESKVRELEIELDYDEGKLIYDVEFDYENREYDYEIDAKSGEIIKRYIGLGDIIEDKKEVNNKGDSANSIKHNKDKTESQANKIKYDIDDDDNDDRDDDEDDRYDDNDDRDDNDDDRDDDDDDDRYDD